MVVERHREEKKEWEGEGGRGRGSTGWMNTWKPYWYYQVYTRRRGGWLYRHRMQVRSASVHVAPFSGDRRLFVRGIAYLSLSHLPPLQTNPNLQWHSSIGGNLCMKTNSPRNRISHQKWIIAIKCMCKTLIYDTESHYNDYYNDYSFF